MGWLSNFAFGYAGYQLSNQEGNQLELLRDDQHIVSAGEFQYQEFTIQNDHCELELTSQVDKGQEMYMAVMEQGEFEWEVEKEGDDFDPETVYEMVVGKDEQTVSIELEPGDYILYFTPTSNTGDLSRLNGSATITDKSSAVGLIKVGHVMSMFLVLLFVGGVFDNILILIAGLVITHLFFKFLYRKI